MAQNRATAANKAAEESRLDEARANGVPWQIMQVLKLCVGQGVQACNLGVPILVEELAHQNRKP